MPKNDKTKPNLKEAEKKAKELVSDLQKESNFFLKKIPATPHWRVFLTLIFLLILFITTLLLAVLTEKIQASEPTNYEECLKLESSKILESYPAVCVTKNGTRFTQQIPEVKHKSIEFQTNPDQNTKPSVPTPTTGNVQGATSSAFENTDTLEEVSECQDLSETERLLYQQEYEECFIACTEELQENECNQICKPVCDQVAKTRVM